MIDEVYEVKQYLAGESVSERGRYRAAYQLARWYTQEGYDFKATRNKIFEWARATNNYLKYNVNDIVTAARNHKERLKDNVIVRISESDVNEIVRLFDSRNARRLALALLCYAKVYADKDGVFDVSMASIGEWIGVAGQNISQRHLPELIALEYVEQVYDDSLVAHWHKKKKSHTHRYKTTRLKINASLYNAGKFELKNNDIDKLYNDIFVKTKRSAFDLV